MGIEINFCEYPAMWGRTKSLLTPFYLTDMLCRNWALLSWRYMSKSTSSSQSPLFCPLCILSQVFLMKLSFMDLWTFFTILVSLLLKKDRKKVKICAMFWLMHVDCGGFRDLRLFPPRGWYQRRGHLERSRTKLAPTGFEPGTFRLQVRRSTTWAIPSPTWMPDGMEKSV